MIVSWRNSLVGGAALVTLAGTLGVPLMLSMGATGAAAAQTRPATVCCGATAPTPSTYPTAPTTPVPGSPATGGGGSNPCCGGGRLVVSVPGVSVPGANLNVGGGSTTSGSYFAHTGSVSSTLGSGVVVYGGGGSSSSTSYILRGGSSGGYSVATQSVAGATGLAVEGAKEKQLVTENVPVEEEYCEDRVRQTRVVRPVQALCIDDKGAPHPASRLNDKTTIDASERGEIYRCLAGTRMQVTLGQVENGEATFVRGETFSCAKGESLVHTGGGKLSCAPQKAERNCNERSLLRKFGPGVKMVEISASENYCQPAKRTRMKQVTREVVVDKPTVGNLVFDGGVGQSVW